ncbi:short-chain dehydrogenase [Mycolicibacterium fortuitum]|uniref:Short-chain dehydrogenase n=1 Tax=Mycolicibacterium fortuitum TaxID=1766 RepID=A0A378V0R2_MYCFO|nr:short-chain dehydrogenase [Mycolicibacterium fortuitum]
MTAKTALVTGGASGIGKAIADRLAADGYQVATLDLNATGDAHSYAADVTDRAQVDAVFKAVRDQLGPVTILVNSAGLSDFTPFTELTFERWQKVVDVNLNGVFHVVQAALPDMIAAGWAASSTSPRRARIRACPTCRTMWPPSPPSTA